MNYQYIVTHPGSAHRDEFLSVCIALATEGAMPVVRREPTEAELNDPTVLVLDVGERHEPALGNFDHHQLPRDHEPECALTLYCRACFLHEVLSLRKWYNITALIDSKGPYEAANVLGLPRFPFELSSPIEAVLLERFEIMDALPADDNSLWRLMQGIGASMIGYAKRAKVAYDEALASVKVCTINGMQVLLWESEIPEQAQAVRDDHYPEAAISLSHDNRGKGWALYRYGDHPNIDFSVLEGHEAVFFAHKAGFIAKTHKRLDLADLEALCIQAMRPCRWQITEWDDDTAVVETWHKGNDVYLRYEDGVCHKLTRKEFENLRPAPVE